LEIRDWRLEIRKGENDMSAYQTAALYGDLVLWLRDRAAELLSEAEGTPSVEEEAARLDELIRGWFFAPNDNLHGLAPRDIIWAEDMGRPNPLPKDQVDDFFFDDCPICQQMKEDLEAADVEGHDHGFHWYYDDGGYPLIAHYDPEGWDARWAEEDREFEAWEAEQDAPTAAPDYAPPPAEVPQVDPETFMEIMRQPWLDPALHQAAAKLADHVDVPAPEDRLGSGYRRITRNEATSLVIGLHRQGVDIDELLSQIDAWPYQNVALDWLSEPEQNAALLSHAMETEIPPDDQVSLTRFRHHRDFIFILANLVRPGARLWLQGWLDAVVQGAFPRET